MACVNPRVGVSSPSPGPLSGYNKSLIHAFEIILLRRILSIQEWPSSQACLDEMRWPAVVISTRTDTPSACAAGVSFQAPALSAVLSFHARQGRAGGLRRRESTPLRVTPARRRSPITSPVDQGEFPCRIVRSGGGGAAVVVVPVRVWGGSDLESQMESAFCRCEQLEVEVDACSIPGRCCRGSRPSAVWRLLVRARARVGADSGRVVGWMSACAVLVDARRELRSVTGRWSV
jgi:hypothetical protein